MKALALVVLSFLIMPALLALILGGRRYSWPIVCAGLAALALIALANYFLTGGVL